MLHRDKLPEDFVRYLEEDVLYDLSQFEMPPPVFEAMKGEIVSYDIEKGLFCCRFPVLKTQLNPYGTMQGGAFAVAIDNTIGPLSMLVAPANITRTMEIKYSKAVQADTPWIYVTARYVEQKKNFLYFEASITDKEKKLHYATAKAVHWIVGKTTT